VAVVALTLGVGSVALVHGESGYEEPPVLKASDLAPAGMLKGPSIIVDEHVAVIDLLGQFTCVRTLASSRRMGATCSV